MLPISTILRDAPDVKAIKEFIDTVGAATSEPVSISRETLRDDVAAITTLTCVDLKKVISGRASKEEFLDALFGKGPSIAIADFHKPKSDPQKKEGVEKENAKERAPQKPKDPATALPGVAASNIGTFVPKASHADALTPPLVASDDLAPIPFPFCHTETVQSAARMAASGRADLAKGMRFLSLPVAYGDKLASFLEHIATDEEIRDALVQIGWQRVTIDGVASAAARLSKGPDEAPVDPHLKVVLFPLGDGTYMKITPLHSNPMMVEMRKRRTELNRRPDPDRRRVLVRQLTVGSGNPINISLQASDMRGVLSMLPSMPPNPRPIALVDRLLYRLKTSGTSLPSNLPKWTIEALRASLQDTRTNQASRTVLENRIARAAHAMLSGPLSLYAATSTGLEINPESISGPIERRLILKGPNDMGPKEVSMLAEHLGSLIGGDAMDDLAHYDGNGLHARLCAGIESALAGTIEEINDETDDVPKAPKPEKAKTAPKPKAVGKKRKSK